MSSSEALPIRVLKDTIPSTSPASFITGSQVIFLSFMSMIASLVNASLFTIIHLHRRTKTSVEIQYYPNKIVKDYAKWWGSAYLWSRTRRFLQLALVCKF
jgi:hypothetical protein